MRLWFTRGIVRSTSVDSSVVRGDSFDHRVPGTHDGAFETADEFAGGFCLIYFMDATGWSDGGPSEQDILRNAVGQENIMMETVVENVPALLATSWLRKTGHPPWEDQMKVKKRCWI